MAEKKFSKAFVLRTTTRHMRRSIDISISKTFERMPEFTGDPRALELFETLDVLHKMRKLIDDFQLNNKHLFKENNTND